MKVHAPASPSGMADSQLRLYTSLTSPFGRKVRLAAICAGLGPRVQVVPLNLIRERERVFALNPLGKIPVLQLPDGRCLHDSRVIIEYLDIVAGNGVLLPGDSDRRIGALCQQSLADGILDATVLQVYEKRYRNIEQQSDFWLAMQREKVDRALAHMQHLMTSRVAGTVPHIGEITLAVALAFLDERISSEWRQTHRHLAAWLDWFGATCPAFTETAPPK